MIVLDLGLPIASGFEVLHEIRQESKNQEALVRVVSRALRHVTSP